MEYVYPIEFPTDGTEYILFPACCYKGNQFRSVKMDYPPFFTPEMAGPDIPTIITDVPRLNPDGSGCIDVTAGDVSVPCIGVYSEKENRAVLVYTVQEINEHNLGLTYEKGKIRIKYPHYREKEAYRWPFMVESTDEGLDFPDGFEMEIPHKCFSFLCRSMEEFYRKFFETRKCMDMADDAPIVLPFKKQFEILCEKFNTMNWYDKKGFYGVTTKDQDQGMAWQTGWVGGGMSSYALMKLGGKLEEERAVLTLHHLFDCQTESGFFMEGTDAEGNQVGIGFASKGMKDLHLIRKSADMLYFLFKHFKVMNEKKIPIPDRFPEGTRRLAEAFVGLWRENGQFGQFIDLRDGKIAVGGSTSAALAPAGLSEAYRYFKKDEYLETAIESAEYLYENFARQGYTTGGPGEILQCPDSESCFSLLESMVVLYEVTKDRKWLDRAEFCAWLCSSWVVAYNYRFPEESEFARLNMKTTGAVFANVQNKHAAPGICTLSGDSLYRLYCYTENPLYYDLFKEISLGVNQYMSTEERPIYSWDVPKDASLLKDDSIRVKREKLPPGYICERVNMSDWESRRCIGGVFPGSCWSEVSNLLILAESADYLKDN